MSGRDELRDMQEARERRDQRRYAVAFEAAKNGGKPKLTLPDVPAHDDITGLCAWLTSVFALDPDHPVTGGVRWGHDGPNGHVTLRRAGAGVEPIRFEPASDIAVPNKLAATLNWSLLPTDGAVHGFDNGHCRVIGHVIRMLCGTRAAENVAAQTEAIIGTFLHRATAIDDARTLTTYGTPAQRYEAAVALRADVDEVTGRRVGPARYFTDRKVDAGTGEVTEELVIPVSDLQSAARDHVGSSLRHGWLDGRMEEFGWQKVTLAGYEKPGRAGRREGGHARLYVYRGPLLGHDYSDGPVNT